MVQKTNKSDTRYNGISAGVTPAGEAVFPRLVEPSTKFKPEGEYSLKLRLPEGPEADALIELIESVCQEAFDNAIADAPNPVAKKKVKRAEPSYTKELDRDTGEETGNWLFNFKMRASGISKKTGKPWTFKPKLFDSNGEALTSFKTNEEIWSGSVVKVAYELRPFYTASVGAGCSQALIAVQILELVSGSGKTAEDFGFGVEKGGYKADTFTDNRRDSDEEVDPLIEGDDADF